MTNFTALTDFTVWVVSRLENPGEYAKGQWVLREKEIVKSRLRAMDKVEPGVIVVEVRGKYKGRLYQILVDYDSWKKGLLPLGRYVFHDEVGRAVDMERVSKIEWGDVNAVCARCQEAGVKCCT